MIIGDVDVPNVKTTSFVVQSSRAVNPAFSDPPQVVGIDFDANGTLALGRCNEMRPNGSQRFGQYHTRPAVKKTIGLVGPGVHRQLAHNTAVLDLENLKTQSFTDGVFSQGFKFLWANAFRRRGPLAHRGVNVAREAWLR